MMTLLFRFAVCQCLLLDSCKFFHRTYCCCLTIRANLWFFVHVFIASAIGYHFRRRCCQADLIYLEALFLLT